MSRPLQILCAIGLAIGLAALGYMIYQDIVEVEETGTSKSMNALLVMAYDMGGKWGVMILWGIISVILVAMSFKWTSGEPEA